MDCPRCGTPNEPGDRFCSSCGASLGKEAPKPQRSPRERIGGLFGTDRRTRLVSLATILAVIVAVIAFIALGEDDEKTIPRDAYTIADISVFAYASHAADGGFDLAPHRHLRAWIERVRAQPGFLSVTYLYSIDPHSTRDLPRALPAERQP